jgi:apolipoprotein N-acyltransferase
VRSPASRIILAWGWRRAALAWIAGAVGALAMPPFGVWPALSVALVAAVWLIDGSAAGRGYSARASLLAAATAGWFWGFGYFVAGLWWLGAAFLVDGDTFAWLMPFGVLGLPAILAFFPALGFALARALWTGGTGRLFALAFGLTASEWLRGHLFTGFPWNTLGMAFGQNLWLMQSSALVGMYGLTALAVLILAAPATIGTAERPAGRYGATALAALALAAMAVYGALRLPAGPTATVAGVKLRIMQPNLSQDAKFGAADAQEILNRYIALSQRVTSPDSKGLADVTHLIWPESAFPCMLPRGAVLITGAARGGETLPGESGRRFFNAIQVVADDGSIAGSYDKVHLVPFGEYVPSFLDRGLRAVGLRQFVQIPGGFTPGDRHRPLTVPGLGTVAATICYEAIFPDEILAGGTRPSVIVNVTNDGWFGDTPGPRQHFAQARLRAVEQGLPLVRAANTGISTIIDPYGRIVATLPVGVEGVLDSLLPQATNGTIYGAYGGALTALMLLGCLAAALSARLGLLQPKALLSFR